MILEIIPRGLRAYAYQLSLRLLARHSPLIWPLDNANDNSPRLGGAA